MNNVIFVPKDKSPFDVLSEMKERITYAWIFMHEDVIKCLRKTCDEEERTEMDSIIFTWYDSQPIGIFQPVQKAFLSATRFTDPWRNIVCIKSADISFKTCEYPREIIFLKMAS